MKIKLDENVGRRGADILKAAGHDVLTVRDQDLAGASDSKLFAVCAAEQRVLISLDFDFAQVLRFPPTRAAGIVVLNPGPHATLRIVNQLIQDFVAFAEDASPVGTLWIIEPGRLRVHLGKRQE